MKAISFKRPLIWKSKRRSVRQCLKLESVAARHGPRKWGASFGWLSAQTRHSLVIWVAEVRPVELAIADIRATRSIWDLPVDLRRKPPIWPLASTARQRSRHFPPTWMKVSSTCQSTLARRKCFSVRRDNSALNLITHRNTVDRLRLIPRPVSRSATS